jgi:hypothetical protein
MHAGACDLAANARARDHAKATINEPDALAPTRVGAFLDYVQAGGVLVDVVWRGRGLEPLRRDQRARAGFAATCAHALRGTPSAGGSPQQYHDDRDVAVVSPALSMAIADDIDATTRFWMGCPPAPDVFGPAVEVGGFARR